jgi:hypothetical protein
MKQSFYYLSSGLILFRMCGQKFASQRGGVFFAQTRTAEG